MDVQFREAASVGNTTLMEQLVRQKVDPFAAGPISKKTAGHRAAEKGHASVLRLLYNWGDTFEKVDIKGKTPAQLSTSPECKTVFDLIKLAQKTIETVDKIFPQKYDVNGKEDLLFKQNRHTIIEATEKIAMASAKELLEVVQEESAAAPQKQRERIFKQWGETQCLPLPHLYDPVVTLMTWENEKIRSGACGENGAVALAYLVHIVKTNYLAELISSEKGDSDHTIVFLNRKPHPDIREGWEGALLVDAFYRKSFFLEHLEAANAPFTLHTLEILRSSSRAPLPEAPWPQQKSLAKLDEIYAQIESMFQNRFLKLKLT